jgi:hypothetical protein
MPFFRLFTAAVLAVYFVWSIDFWVTAIAIVGVRETLADPVTWITLGLVPVGLIVLVAVRVHLGGQWSYADSLAGLFLVLLAVAPVLIVYTGASDQGRAVAIVVGVVLATAGWIVNSYISLRNHDKQAEHTRNLQRKQHSMNVLLQTRQNPIFNDHRLKLIKAYPPGTDIPLADKEHVLNDPGAGDPNAMGGANGQSVSDHVYYIANHYEFIAAAIRQGDMDEELFKQTLRGIMVNFHKKTREYIRVEQKVDAQGKPTNKAFEHYDWLYERWKDEG